MEELVELSVCQERIQRTSGLRLSVDYSWATWRRRHQNDELGNG